MANLSRHGTRLTRSANGRGTPVTWAGIRGVIMDRITHGIYPPGSLIPTEQEFAAEFGSARATVNRALTSLAERGVGPILDELCRCVGDHFAVRHATFQLEPASHRAHEDLGEVH